MKTIAVAVAVALAGLTLAHAQTTSPGQSPSSQPSTSMPNSTTVPRTPEAPTAKTQPNSGITTGSTTPSTPAAPLPGANSFTESQARSRIESSGFTGVTNLKKDANGIWQGAATKDGKQQTVSLDYQGNIAAK